MKVTYADNALDPGLLAAFGPVYDPQFFIIDNGIAYSFDYSVPAGLLLQWISTRAYKRSPLQFPLPAPYTHFEAWLRCYLPDSARFVYTHLAAPYITHAISYIPATLRAIPPVAWFHDEDEKDVFFYKRDR